MIKGNKEKKQLSSQILFKLANQHFFAAKCLLKSYDIKIKSEPYTFFSAAYLLHLSIELVLKGCISCYKDGRYKFEHDLLSLGKQLAKLSGKDISVIEDRLEYFNNFYERYELGEYSISLEDIEEGLYYMKMLGNKTSKKIYDIFSKVWNDDLSIAREGFEYKWETIKYDGK